MYVCLGSEDTLDMHLCSKKYLTIYIYIYIYMYMYVCMYVFVSRNSNSRLAKPNDSNILASM